MYLCMCEWFTLPYSRKLTERCKPAIIEKIKIIKKKKKTTITGALLCKPCMVTGRNPVSKLSLKVNSMITFSQLVSLSPCFLPLHIHSLAGIFLSLSQEPTSIFTIKKISIYPKTLLEKRNMVCLRSHLFFVDNTYKTAGPKQSTIKQQNFKYNGLIVLSRKIIIFKFNHLFNHTQYIYSAFSLCECDVRMCVLNLPLLFIILQHYMHHWPSLQAFSSIS